MIARTPLKRGDAVLSIVGKIQAPGLVRVIGHQVQISFSGSKPLPAVQDARLQTNNARICLLLIERLRESV
jgi:hypothetical protein